MFTKLSSLICRYLTVFILGLGNLLLFYKIFTFPTVYFSAKLLSFFGSTTVISNWILFEGRLIEIANACVAGSAYYLLFFLSMSISLKLFKQFILIIYLFLSFLFVNVIRVTLMGFLITGPLFQEIHLMSWYFFSTILVILLWFSAVWLFKIREIPVLTDLNYLISLVEHSKKTKTGYQNK